MNDQEPDSGPLFFIVGAPRCEQGRARRAVPDPVAVELRPGVPARVEALGRGGHRQDRDVLGKAGVVKGRKATWSIA